jgi:hypothetical protein
VLRAIVIADFADDGLDRFFTFPLNSPFERGPKSWALRLRLALAGALCRHIRIHPLAGDCDTLGRLRRRRASGDVHRR